MNSSVLMKIIILGILVLALQIFIPVININGVSMTPDILIIFLTYVGYYYGRLEAIILGFVLFEEIPSLHTIIGAIIIIGATLYLMTSQKKPTQDISNE